VISQNRFQHYYLVVLLVQPITIQLQIPVDALDDQTITDKPQFLDLPDTTSTASNIVTLATSVGQTGRGAYVYKDFSPPVSRLMLGVH
jgi:hypothetical protein